MKKKLNVTLEIIKITDHTYECDETYYYIRKGRIVGGHSKSTEYYWAYYDKPNPDPNVFFSSIQWVKERSNATRLTDLRLAEKAHACAIRYEYDIASLTTTEIVKSESI